MKQLKDVAATLCGVADKQNDLEMLREGLVSATLHVFRDSILTLAQCFRPVTSSGRPIISRVPDQKIGIQTLGGSDGGVFVAAGHGAWGKAVRSRT